MNSKVALQPFSKLGTLINFLYFRINRPTKRWIFKSIDSVILLISIYLAFSLRFDIFNVWELLPKYKSHLYILIPTKILFFWVIGMYRPVIRYAGIEFITTAAKGVFGGTVIFVILSFAILSKTLDLLQFPRSIIIIDAVLSFFFIAFARIIIRWILVISIETEGGNNKPESIIIYGAGRVGCQLVQTLSRENAYKVICFIDDNPKIQKHQISGKTVFSPLRLGELIEKYQVDSIILAIHSAGKKRKEEVINGIRHHNIQVKTVPDITKILNGEISVNEIRNIDIIDLLGREEASPDPTLLEADIKNKVVMVTGAGGSIGSELCRQILGQNPNHLILFERSEYALYTIDTELRQDFPMHRIDACLGSVTIQERVEEVLKKYSVNIIYHAAAYKHVPLIESNISEGIFNNINGTLRCVLAAEKCQVSTFVLVSTDKAVRPTNIMGTTKRIAELILQAAAKKKKSPLSFCYGSIW